MTRTSIIRLSTLALAFATGCGADDDGPSAASVEGEVSKLSTTSDATQELVDAQAAQIASLTARLDTLESDLAAITTQDLATQGWVQSQGYASQASVAEVRDDAEGLVAANTDAIQANTDAIGLNNDAIGLNSADIVLNTDAIGVLSGDVAGNAALIAGHSSALSTAQTDLTTLDTRTLGVDQLMAYVSVDVSLDRVTLTGANLQIVSGAGTTDAAVNGLGNIIIGYDLDSSDDKTGSHNLVVGDGHTYSSYGGIVGGHNNALTGIMASILGGHNNGAAGDYATVGGGYYGRASGAESTIGGGMGNVASGQYAAVSAGYYGDAIGDKSSVSGGVYNQATGSHSSISGGYSGLASEYGASVVGGGQNEASGELSTVLGGAYNVASGYGSTVYGGYDKETTGLYSYGP